MNKKEKQLSTLEELQKRLNGQCNDGLDACPMNIANTTNISTHGVWNCENCTDMFKEMINLEECRKIMRETTPISNPCPCTIAQSKRFNLDPEDVIQRLDEYIEELKEELYG